jgi:hypothetical protein
MADKEKIADEIAFILLTSFDNEEDVRVCINEARDLAIRGLQNWWELVGAPHYTERLQRLRMKLGK